MSHQRTTVDVVERELDDETMRDHQRAKVRGERLRRILNAVSTEMLACGRFSGEQATEAAAIFTNVLCQELYPGVSVDV